MRPKKKKVDRTVLVLEYDGEPPFSCVFVYEHAIFCFLKIIHEYMAHCLLGKCELVG